MIVKMIKNLENRREKVHESINEDLEKLKNKHTETNNTIIEIKILWKESRRNDYSLMAQMVKRLPAMWETRVRSLGWEDPLEKEMATHSSILAWRIPWTEELGRLQSMGSQRVGLY